MEVLRSLGATALVHEAYPKLVGEREIPWASRSRQGLEVSAGVGCYQTFPSGERTDSPERP